MNRILARTLLPAFLITTLHAEPAWIWPTKTSKNGEKVTMKTTFTVDADVKSATLSLSCDNSAKVSINGIKAGESGSWNEPIIG